MKVSVIRDFWKQQDKNNRLEALDLSQKADEVRKQDVENYIDENQLWGDICFVEVTSEKAELLEASKEICRMAAAVCFAVARAWK